MAETGSGAEDCYRQGCSRRTDVSESSVNKGERGMIYDRLGACGLKVSEICMGTMTFGKSTDETDAKRMVDMAWDAGINFFDTADAYGGGRAEEMLGTALSSRRKDAVVATKVFNPTGSGINDSGGSRAHIINAIEHSLRRLKTDFIDVYYVHHLDVETPVEETLRTLDDLVRSGKIRYIACSNYPAWRLCDAIWTSHVHGLERFVCYQAHYNLVVRDIEQELVPLCLDKGLGILSWSPLAGGFLTGKYEPGMRKVAGTRSEEGWVWHDAHFPQSADDTLATVLTVADETGKSPAQVSLRWVAEQEGVASVVVGARTPEQFADNLGAAGWTLPDDARRRLSEISRPQERYPATIERRMPNRRAAAVAMPRQTSEG